MSWDAWLTDAAGNVVHEANYTHNTNRMIHQALLDAGTSAAEALWCWGLDGRQGPAGAAYLHGILRQLEADPARYEAMNPANGWGDYATLVAVLTEMRDSVPEWPTVWSVYV